MADFMKALKEVFRMEGKYADNKKDPGGKTMYGVTEAVARSVGYKGDMKDLTTDQAREIYKELYWDINRLDSVNNQEIAMEIFEAGVNCGPKFVSKYTQRALNVFNRMERDWADMEVDGTFGPITLGILNNLSPSRESNILKALNCLQGYHYITCGERNENLEVFMPGWFNHRISLNY